MKFGIVMISAMLCVADAYAAPTHSDAGEKSAAALDALQGRFDNSRQVARATASADNPLAHVVVVIEPTRQKGWSLWHVHLNTDAETSFDQTWAMQAQSEYDGSIALIPSYQFKQTSEPTAATFDPKDWLSLEACSLRGDFGKTRIEAMSEGEPCVAVSMSVGARRALLPVGFVFDGDSLQLDFNLRGQRTRLDTVRSR